MSCYLSWAFPRYSIIRTAYFSLYCSFSALQTTKSGNFGDEKNTIHYLLSILLDVEAELERSSSYFAKMRRLLT